FLCEGGGDGNYYGQRVELNAFASDDFIKWVESKLEEHGIKKIVPDEDTLKEAYARAVKVAVINRAIEDATEKAEKTAEKLTMPKTLTRMIRKRLKNDPTSPWDKVIAEVAEAHCKKRTRRRNGKAS
ncbi:unnamed protein product, partial [marine sediment metagenome]